MITVHAIVGSPFGRAAMIAAIEKQLDWRLAPVVPGQHREAAYLARQPFARIPAIDHDGWGLYETQAILRYFDAIGRGPSLTPADPKAAARMNQVMGIIDWYFFTQGSALTVLFNRVVAPRLGMPVNEAAIIEALPKARHCIGVLAGFLEHRPWMAGDAFSLADIHAGAHMQFLAEAAPEGPDLIAGTPIPAWLARLDARPSFQRTTWNAVEAMAKEAA
jgi:glutathione S-transferase